MRRLIKDPLFRRFVLASLFAAAFVWVAVTYFHVEMGVVGVFLQMSFVFVGAMIVTGLILAPIVSRFNRKPGFLVRLSRGGETDGAVRDEPPNRTR